jgi:hypothetical protein
MPEKPKNENVQLPCRPHENTNASDCLKGLPISTLYLDFARTVLPDELRMQLHLRDTATYGDALVKVVFDEAIKGNMSAVRELREGIEGKASPRRNPVGAEKFEVVIRYEEPPLLTMMPKGSPDTPNE